MKTYSSYWEGRLGVTAKSAANVCYTTDAKQCKLDESGLRSQPIGPQRRKKTHLGSGVVRYTDSSEMMHWKTHIGQEAAS